MRIDIAKEIPEDSWLRKEEYQGFLEGYEYAATQTYAIYALSLTSPTQMFYAVEAIIRGAMQIPADQKIDWSNLPIQTKDV